MNLGRRAHNQPVAVAAQLGYRSSRLGCNEQRRAEVPALQAQVVEPVKSSASNRADIEGTAAQASQVADAWENVAQNVRLSLATSVIRMNPGTHQRTPQKGHIARAYLQVVATRSGPSTGAEQVPSRKVNYNTGHCDTIHFDANGHRRAGQVIYEVRRAVDRVDDPSHSSQTSNGSTLFAQDAVVGTLLENALHKGPLGPFVSARDWTPMTILESDRHASMTGALANATCNVGRQGDCDVEEFLSTGHVVTLALTLSVDNPAPRTGPH